MDGEKSLNARLGLFVVENSNVSFHHANGDAGNTRALFKPLCRARNSNWALPLLYRKHSHPAGLGDQPA
jgi:hypothetical protein